MSSLQFWAQSSPFRLVFLGDTLFVNKKLFQPELELGSQILFTVLVTTIPLNVATSATKTVTEIPLNVATSVTKNVTEIQSVNLRNLKLYKME